MHVHKATFIDGYTLTIYPMTTNEGMRELTLDELWAIMDDRVEEHGEVMDISSEEM